MGNHLYLDQAAADRIYTAGNFALPLYCGLCCFVPALSAADPDGSFKEEGLFIAAALCGVTLYFLIENVALLYTSASNAGVIVSIAPFLTAVISHFALPDERLTPAFITGFLIALSGIVCILLNGSFALQLNPHGDLLALLAPVVWAVYSVLMRNISALQHNTIGATRKVFFYGLLGIVPALLVFDFRLGLERFRDPPIWGTCCSSV